MFLYARIICPGNVRPYDAPLLWLVFDTVGHYMAISDYVADHKKRFQMILWNVSTCNVCFNFVGNTQKHNKHLCPSVHAWTETKNTYVIRYGLLWPSVHVWAVRSYKTPLLWLVFGTVGHFCGFFVYVQPHKIDSHTAKKKPKFMDNSRHKTPFCGSRHTNAATKTRWQNTRRHLNSWTQVATA